MKIKCLRSYGRYEPLVLPYVYGKSISDLNFIVSHEWHTIDSEVSGYSLSVSIEYTVYGLLFYRNELRYLIIDNNNIPGFFPADLFEIIEGYMQFDWEVNEFRIDSDRLFVIGYAELLSDYSKIRDLIDRNSSAIRAFLEYKESL